MSHSTSVRRHLSIDSVSVGHMTWKLKKLLITQRTWWENADFLLKYSYKIWWGHMTWDLVTKNCCLYKEPFEKLWFFIKLLIQNTTRTHNSPQTGVSHSTSIKRHFGIHFVSMGHMTWKLFKRNADYVWNLMRKTTILH